MPEMTQGCQESVEQVSVGQVSVGQLLRGRIGSSFESYTRFQPLPAVWLHPRRRVSQSDPSGSQNRKYFCAIGSTFAGSQVSNCPSARTWYVCASISMRGV